ncbi:cation/calcium exchanger 4 [Coffea arabica]|uniref:Cation/calcium exchanger 4 n=1 Tax=Coffea arabica TaxID=13443 RepID=A0A6P6SN39_COFAR
MHSFSQYIINNSEKPSSISSSPFPFHPRKRQKKKKKNYPDTSTSSPSPLPELKNMNILTWFSFCKPTKFRGSFNVMSFLVLLFLLAHRREILQSPFSDKSSPILSHIWISKSHDFEDKASGIEVIRRKTQENSVENGVLTTNKSPSLICSGLYNHTGYGTKCEYLRANPQCNSGGFFNYILFFYCVCQKFSALGSVILGIWLVVLFYLLGNTAADYFCCSLEKLSNLLKLPPTVAGVTLLPLGNGAPDVFSSIAAFVGRDSGEVGLNSVLGGAVFVVCVVVGTVSLCVSERNVRIDKKCFIRDVCFFLVALGALLVILIVGDVTVGGAIGFVSIYVVYALFVAASEVIKKHPWSCKPNSAESLLLPVSGNRLANEAVESESVQTPLLQSDSAEAGTSLQDKLPHWMWASNVAIYSNEVIKVSGTDSPKFLWGWNEEDTAGDQSSFSCSKLCSWLELPLTIPRRSTIPIVDEERWSKGYAVASAFLAPLLLAFLWNTRDDVSFLAKATVYLVGAVVGGTLGVLAFVYTKADHPPQRFVLPWVLGGFLMSIIWFYIVANELVALLVAFGVIFGIQPSLLALTVMAWGNSMGDLMSNVAMAMNGGDGVQIAMSGSYAGPMFNTLAGLGISLLLGAWSDRPSSYVVPRDSSLYFTLGFVVLGLVWSLAVLPWNNMRPTKLLGMGLMVIYLVFLSFRASLALNDESMSG